MEVTHEHYWQTTYTPGLCVCKCGVGRSYDRHTQSYQYYDSTQYSCVRCGEYTENGAGAFLEELNTEDTLCSACYRKAIA